MNVKESSARVGGALNTAFGFVKRLTAPAPPRLAIQTMRHNIAITRRETLAFWLLPETDYEGFSARKRDEHQGEWAQRFAELGDNAARLYLSEIAASFDGVAYFPELDRGEWTEIARERHPAGEGIPFAFDFVRYDRRTVPVPLPV